MNAMRFAEGQAVDVLVGRRWNPGTVVGVLGRRYQVHVPGLPPRGSIFGSGITIRRRPEQLRAR
jgi:hypothetical protein